MSERPPVQDTFVVGSVSKLQMVASACVEALMLGWIDLETTGLSPADEHVLEVGSIVTDDELNVIARHSWVAWSDPEVEQQSHQIVRDMHTASGLWVESQNSDLTIGEIDSHLIDFLDLHHVENGPLCGSSVHFDREFMRWHLSLSLKSFGYRNIDVSSFKETFKRMWPDREYKPDGDKPHRALADLENSIAELRHYLSFVRS